MQSKPKTEKNRILRQWKYDDRFGTPFFPSTLCTSEKFDISSKQVNVGNPIGWEMKLVFVLFIRLEQLSGRNGGQKYPHRHRIFIVFGFFLRDFSPMLNWSIPRRILYRITIWNEYLGVHEFCSREPNAFEREK